MGNSLQLERRSERPKWGPRGTAAATFAGELTFENVSLSYGPVRVVHGVSFQLKPGEIVCLLGPSGCGKTSLLRLAAGIEQPDDGRILLDGRVIAGEGKFVPPEKRNIGLMFQDFALFPHLNIIENVAFGLNSLSKTAAQEEALNALRRVGLEHYARQYPHALSGGEQQRAALARALVPRPAILLMDEPFSGLDERLRENIRQETLSLLRETRATTILVTHDPKEAMRLADRIVLMRDGHLVQSGEPEELFFQPADAKVARFFNDFNELTARVENGKALSPIGAFECPAGLDGRLVTVMIKPQAVVPCGDDHPNRLSGRLLESRFLGDCYELMVQFEALDAPMIARIPPSCRPVGGEVMQFSVQVDDILIFEAGTNHT